LAKNPALNNFSSLLVGITACVGMGID